MATASSNLQPTTFTYQLLIQLNHDNYFSWKFLILPHAREHELIDFLDGTNPPLDATITLPDGASVPNPDYTIWHRQD
jgi:hypothetical protein